MGRNPKTGIVRPLIPLLYTAILDLQENNVKHHFKQIFLFGRLCGPLLSSSCRKTCYVNQCGRTAPLLSSAFACHTGRTGSRSRKMTLTSFARNAILNLYEIQRENSVFFAGKHSFCLPAEKQNQGRWMGPRETAYARSRRGMQKLSGKRIGSGRHFGKCGAAAHQRGNRALCAAGNLSGRDGGRRTSGVFLSEPLKNGFDQ